jgi:hypothetical protein
MMEGSQNTKREAVGVHAPASFGGLIKRCAVRPAKHARHASKIRVNSCPFVVLTA